MTNENEPAIQESIRDEKGRFIPGHSGNPAGKPEGTLSLRTLLRKRLTEHPEQADSIIDGLILLGVSKDLPSIKEIADWTDGKLADKLEMRGTMLVATPDQLDFAISILLEDKMKLDRKLLDQGG